MHWIPKNKLKQHWKLMVQMAVKEAKLPRMLGPVLIEVETHSKRQLKTWDLDNRSVKPLLDGLTDAYEVVYGKMVLISKGVLPNDNAEVIREIRSMAFQSKRDETICRIKKYEIRGFI